MIIEGHNINWYYNDSSDRQLFYMHFNEEPKFCEALAYLLTFENHTDFKVTPHNFSIEISNSEMHIFVIHAVGFQQIEYEEAKKLKNVHFVSTCEYLFEMVEFSEMKKEIKFISKRMLMATVIALTEDEFIRAMESFKNLKV